MNTDDYFYELSFDAATINAVKDAYNRFAKNTYVTDYSRTLYKDLKIKKINDVLTENDILPTLVSFLSGTGINVSILPLASSQIHIDQIDLIDSPGTSRNIAINFPIQMCNSVTSFYANPLARTRDPLFHYSIAQYLKEPTPICSFHMGEQAVLFNTRVFHSVKNLSSTETRTILSFSFDIKYSMFDCIEIMKRLGYAE